jgi:hypothetical protein
MAEDLAILQPGGSRGGRRNEEEQKWLSTHGRDIENLMRGEIIPGTGASYLRGRGISQVKVKQYK